MPQSIGRKAVRSAGCSQGQEHLSCVCLVLVLSEWTCRQALGPAGSVAAKSSPTVCWAARAGCPSAASTGFWLGKGLWGQVPPASDSYPLSIVSVNLEKPLNYLKISECPHMKWLLCTTGAFHVCIW